MRGLDAELQRRRDVRRTKGEEKKKRGADSAEGRKGKEGGVGRKGHGENRRGYAEMGKEEERGDQFIRY